MERIEVKESMLLACLNLAARSPEIHNQRIHPRGKDRLKVNVTANFLFNYLHGFFHTCERLYVKHALKMFGCQDKEKHFTDDFSKVLLFVTKTNYAAIFLCLATISCCTLAGTSSY